MSPEPTVKRAVAFVDGQNLFYAARNAFGHKFPNHDVAALAAAVCRQQGWQLEQTRFYTGFPDSTDDGFWNHFWTAKLAQMGRQKVHVFCRPLRYRNQTVHLIAPFMMHVLTPGITVQKRHDEKGIGPFLIIILLIGI